MASLDAQPPRRTSAHVARKLDALMSYLPALLMGGVALGTLWLTQTVDVRESEKSSKTQLSQGADYELTGFVARSFDAAGRLTTVVKGTHAVHDPGPGVLVVKTARMESHHLQSTSRVQAEELWVYDDQERFELRGKVLVVREPMGREPVRFEATRVLVHSTPRVIEVPEPVRITRGDDVMAASSMVHEEATGVITMKGAVKATFAAPKKASAQQKRRL